MDVHLLVYDLSQGLARQMSMGLLGFQLDAVYHTSIEVYGREYVYDGGIIAIAPGSSHLGRPMERLRLGSTSLSLAVIDEYIDSLRPIFTVEAYDLFHHNCNNFSDTLAKFLVGTGIPHHIASMPQAVLDSPMGRMLVPQLTQGLGGGRARQNGSILGLQESARAAPAGPPQPQPQPMAPLDGGTALPPHPHDRLRLPTFAAARQRPPQFVLYAKVPPLDKLVAKLGADVAAEPAVRALRQYLEARAAATAATAAATAIPDTHGLARLVQTSVKALPADTLFAVVDLFRCSLADPRISGYFAEEADHATLRSVLGAAVGDGGDGGDSTGQARPYALRIVTLQAACNLFSTPLVADAVFAPAAAAATGVGAQIVQLVTASFLDDGHARVRVAAASLLYNLALASRDGHGHGQRQREGPVLSADDRVELAASVVEAIGQETESADALHGMLLALGHLAYRTPLDGDLADALRALDAAGTVVAKKKTFPHEALLDEVGSELLGKGLQHRR